MSKITFKLNAITKMISLLIIFVFITGFNVIGNPCDLQVNAGTDQNTCPGEEVTLTASISGESTCGDCLVYGIENTYRCEKDLYYVLWLKDDANNIVRRFSNVDLEWAELADGTATLKGTVVDNNDDQLFLEVDVVYSGRTSEVPAGSPKEHFCNQENADGWIYYTDVSGSIGLADGSWSFNITRKGPSFQLGNGANTTEDEIGKYGGSGWFDTTDSDYNRGDFNINIGECISSEPSEVSYLWSTGETTPTITVSPDNTTTYTVTVKDCKDCEATDEVVVNIAEIEVSAGRDQTFCVGSGVGAKLTASLGDSYLWSTGETTRSITVFPKSTTAYDVTVTIGDCSDSDEVTVFVDNSDCDSTESIMVFPTIVRPGGKLSIDLNSKKDQNVIISLHNLSGRNIGSLVNNQLTAGANTLDYDMSNMGEMSEGIYLLRIIEEDKTMMKKIVIQK
ncbi:T9SS type A sorting domain-containing protein [Aquimarina sp. MMG016]|uniref:T9SS type A sorting domain-containing protein n=1 Tax=Aquimarina sp. MMG016 TaxID=2822690 RepID=UPI001B39E362|nr:T9SS type A sorting domain-containing protein [Aquimarina sp. MMG016]MBQ4820663.1 T9SS type A sorting domain-containing protein [Aquimarina sp. MMG016]